MGARDYMPTTDAGFDIFQDNFIKGVQPFVTLWEIPTVEFNKVQSGIYFCKSGNRVKRLNLIR